MCYNISVSSKEEKTLEKRLGATYPKQLGQLKLLFTVSGFIHPKLPVLTTEQPDCFQIMRWGLIPKWTPNLELAKQFSDNNLNAKSETVFEKPSFKESIMQRRCLIPINGFFEWRSIGKNKYPYFIRLRETDIFCLGGIYDDWVDKSSGEIIPTFSILTTAANPLMALIHNSKLRMPLILEPQREKDWLNTEMNESEVRGMLQAIDEKHMYAYTISRRITDRKADPNTPEVLAPYTYPELALIDAQ